MKMPRRHAPSGIALIIVMISIMVLAVLAGGFAYSMKVETKLARHANSDTQLEWLGRSGVELARYVLAMQLTIPNEPYDSLNQKWAGGPGSLGTTNHPLADISLENTELGEGRFSIKITDLERKININLADETILQQALMVMGVEAGEFPEIISSILDWIDRDDDTHIGGTESSYYEGLMPPYVAKNGPIDDLSELLLVKGITPELFWGPASTNAWLAAFQVRTDRFGRPVTPVYTMGLVDIFTPISSGKINLNTAPETVLQVLPFMDPTTASEIIRLRAGPDGADGTEDDTPLHNPGELINVGLSPQIIPQLTRICDVRSRTFEVVVDAEVGGYKRQFVAILGRNSPRDVQVLTFYWR